ncbi:MAG TPA: [LysW]-lysine hydrolase [Candidatus Thermoplasmatota archaeon]|nr:[LysW]-lysine hydrolase [Candidatus Thermoplasmatota archaeon]
MRPDELLEALVRIPSPTGEEAEAVAFLQEQARADGFRVVADAAGNFIAEAGRGAKLLLFVGHIDTVPGAIPVRREGDVLWGRGSVDAKGPLVAAYCAARRHLDAGARIRIVGAVGEEGDSRGAKTLDRSERPDWIVVGEPSGADGLTLGYKGILRGTLSLRAPVRHGGHPGAGAIEAFLDAWQEVRRELALADGFTTLQGRLDRIASRHDGLADEVEATLQVRLPPGAMPETVAARVEAIARRHGAALQVTEALAPHVAERKTPLVAAFLASLRAGGLEPRLKHKTGTADFNHLAQWFPGVPMVAYGPGDASLDHTPEERASLAELAQAVDVLDRVFARFAQ